MLNQLNRKMDATRRRDSEWRRTGFTLVELLIVVAILLIIAVMTAYAINLSTNTDRVRAGARQVQSYLAGARDRAIYAGAPRGVRFLLDPTNNRTVSSMVFIQQTDPWTQGSVRLERLDVNNDGIADGYDPVSNPNPPALVLRGDDNNPDPNILYVPTGWTDLMNEGLLYNGSRIQIGGLWYTVTIDLLVNASPPGTPAPSYYPPRLHLTTSYSDAPQPPGNQVNAQIPKGRNYALDLPPSVLPGAEAVQMPKGSVIHLDRCTSAVNLEQTAAGPPYPNRGDRLPSAWKQTPSVTQPFTGSPDPTNFDYTTTMDVLFSPRGVVTGTAGQRGIIHFYIGEQKDADRDRLSYWSTASYPTQSTPEYGTGGDGNIRGDKVILSLFTRTGAVSTHNIFSNADPFKFAETGQVAGK